MTTRSIWTHRLACLALALGLSACGEGEPPAAPSVDAPPVLTNDDPIVLTGTAEADALVQIRGGAGGPAEGPADADGSFAIEVALEADAENTLLVSQTVGGLESEATTVRITHDGTAPEAPAVDPVTSPTRRDQQRLRGTTEANATVRVTGGAEDARTETDDAGRFELDVVLEADALDAVENTLAVTAVDVAGNESAATDVTITVDPTLAVEAPVLDDFPAHTSADTVTLTGSAEPGVGISAVGGATDGMAMADAEGSFSVDVGLRPNRSNEILVFAVVAGSTSSAASAVIVHDDVAPSVPTLHPQASPTGAESVPLTGETEPGATVSVSGGAADASVMSDDDGAFRVDVMLTLDTDNELAVVATDAAGNASEAATLTITQDSTLDAPVVVDPVTSPTADATVMLTGSAEASVDLEITGGASPVSTSSDASGDWSASVDLNANTRNELHVTRVGSDVETIVVVEHDDVAPDAPALNTVPSPTGSTTVRISGTSEARARISVSGGESPAMGRAELDGRFAVDVTIAEESESTLSVLATDAAGNTSSPSTVTVTHSADVPEAPIVDETNPAPTNAATHVVTGRVASPGEGIDVRIDGGAAVAMGPTDPDSGTFAVEVSLSANASNELQVVSVMGAIESPATVVTVVHDDMAPAAPDTSLVTAEGTTGSFSCGTLGVRSSGYAAGMAGSVEGGVEVFVWNVTDGDAEPTPARGDRGADTATSMGSFNASIPACPGDTIGLKVMDAAGNVSAFVEVSAS
ncbi:MAG TPA: Ig-like domain-containing protein [Sandaracinaceae bacterium LLY-WYZ-13_1]|nr:Ig-like domain-containing protein [Sandaracinaceae bacterium LLY-WYZ-13_1]